MTVTGTESYTTTYEYHPNNWLLKEKKRQGKTVETARYRYDANGNQVYREWEKYSPKEVQTGRAGFVQDSFVEDIATLDTREYNGFNQLVSVYRDGVRSQYSYRPDGLRYSKTVKDRKNVESVHIHLWDGQNIVAEIGATGVVNTRYLRGINLVTREIDTERQYYLFNAHGDVVQSVDAYGNMKNYKYDAFGNEENPEKLDSNPFRYCGEYLDKETGEIYLRARYYDPATGRFGAEDPARHGLNWYTYCSGNPIALVDPTGHYYVVQSGSAYNLAHDSELRIMAGVAAQFILFAGGLAWREPPNTVGGTSHDVESILGGYPIWNSISNLADGNEISSIITTYSNGTLKAIGPYIGAYNSVDYLKQKGSIAETDYVLFKLIKFYGLPTQFNSKEKAIKQMDILYTIYKSNLDYLTGSSGIYAGSQFQRDMKLRRIKNSRTLGAILLEEEKGISQWEIMAKERKNNKFARNYVNQSNYMRRINKLQHALKKHS
ncbi:RHS repeat-associated core domain-containing protein [Oscillospiraceae bacterium PP1C4]